MQRTEFLEGAGDDFWHRNEAPIAKLHAQASADPSTDPVLRALEWLRPVRILEVGAANGWRLDLATKLWGAQGTGVDPSHDAVEDGKKRFPDLTLSVGTAEQLAAPNGAFDCVIFGFCLYLCDRADLFRIASEADRVLADRGYIVVYDFFPPSPYFNPYKHRIGLFSHKMDHSQLWSWHPSYVLWSHTTGAHGDGDADDPNERVGVTILKKLAHPRNFTGV